MIEERVSAERKFERRLANIELVVTKTDKSRGMMYH
jgi:hypothetical protein